MARMHAPRVHEDPPAVLPEDSVRALLRARRATGPAERRDTALTSYPYDSGMRLGEIAGLTVDDLDPAQGTVYRASAASERARTAHRRLSPLDRR